MSFSSLASRIFAVGCVLSMPNRTRPNPTDVGCTKPQLRRLNTQRSPRKRVGEDFEHLYGLVKVDREKEYCWDLGLYWA